MRELHVVATSEDGRHVVLATSKKASTGDFRVALDDRLEAAVRGDLRRPGGTEPAVVTPKEIQARLRAGESPEQIAASAGVPVSRIDRYAGPVLSERERVISQARAGTVSRSRLGQSALPLGEAVDRHLSLTTGVRMETVQWSARREEAGSWLVELAYVSQARRRTATWRYDISRREVTAVDSASAALAHVEPGRRVRAAEPDAPPARASSRTASRRAAPVRERKPAAPAARTVAARPAPPVRAAAAVPTAPAQAKAAQKAAAAEAAAAEAAAAEAAAAEAAAAEAAAAEAAAEAARAAAAASKAADAQAEADTARAAKAAADEAAPTGPPTLRVVGSEGSAEPARRGAKQPPAAARTTPARAAGQRASVPGWADVLLSTAPVARPVDPDPDAD